jgi:ABC-type lipoprotein export system ATPase subunit
MNPRSADAMIRLESLEFAYADGGFRLRVPSLSVERGETVAMIGPSGSGKTTLLNLIAGIRLPHAGTIRTDGVIVNRLSDTDRRTFRITRLGLVFQEFELLEYLSALDNILLPYRIHPALELNATVRARAIELAERVGLADRLERQPSRLSQGERQRLAVCRAVLPCPAIVLADEPTGNLDPENKTRVLDILFSLIEETESTLVSVTHDHELIPRFDRVVDFAAFQADRVAR